MKLKSALVGTFVSMFMGFFAQEYNLPPGDVMKSKFTISTELTTKFEFINNASDKSINDGNFLYFFSNDALEDLKINSPERFEYYMQAQTFYNSLSNKVKNLYKKDEIWEIYMYDNSLLEKIKNIK